MKKVKLILCVTALALFAAFVLAGCGGSRQDVSARESVASDVKSKADEIADDIGDGVTNAVSAVVSEADRMAENGRVSDDDGVIE